MDFSDRLQNLRVKRGITQTELAKKLDVKQQTISQYEKGLLFPKMDILVKLAEILNVQIGFLIRGATIDSGSKEFSDDIVKLLELYDSLPTEKKNISIELLKVLKDTSKNEV